MNPNHILLINPEISVASQSKTINSIVNTTFPTSLGVLAGWLLGMGINVEIFDEQIHDLSDRALEKKIEGLARPRIIGISVWTMNCGRAYDLAEKIKRIDPQTIVMVGGIHATVLPDEPLRMDGVDLVVRGEAEETIGELAEAILQGKDYTGIAGISYRKNGEIVHNPERPLLMNLDKIPPFPYHLFEGDLDQYPSFSGIISSRGCPFKCTFCSSRSISGLKFRFHSTARVISEIKVLVEKYKQPSVHLMDDNIAVHRPHFKELCDAIVSEGLHKKAFFHGSMRGDNARDEILDYCVKANFKMLYFGLETGNERLMKVIDKGETLQEIVDAVHRAYKRGIAVGATVIFGLPSEMRCERYETIKLVNSLPLASIRFNTLAPYPGTPVYVREEPKGKLFIKERWENFGVQHMWESDDIPYVPDGNDRLELMFDTMYANLQSYVSWRGFQRMFTSKYAGGNVIKLEKHWYYSFTEINKLGSAFFYLFFRFVNITLRMLLQQFVRRIKSWISRPVASPEPLLEKSHA